MNITLRDYQNESVEAVRDAYRDAYRSPLLVLPTGGGKTVVFSYITEQMDKNGKRVYILVHRQELLYQTSKKLSEFGVTHGIISPGHSMTGDRVQVASVQTLVRRLERYPSSDLLIVDEAHHAGAGTWSKILSHYSNSKILGVTATPIRMDGKGLGVDCGGFFDTLVEGPTTASLIQQGYLSEPIVFAPPSGIDFNNIPKRGGDFDKKILAERTDKPKITGCAIEHYSKLCPGVPAICFCVSIAHAEHVAAEFRAAGWAAESLDGTMSDSVRKARINSLASGQIKVLTSCDIISEGTDIPVVGAAILLRATKSLGLYLQQVGRALRVYPGKKNAYILDHVGNCFVHGLPDEIRSWSLHGLKQRGKKDKDDNEPGLKLKQCEKCYQVYRQGVVACPFCGHIPKTGREIQQVDGELQVVNKVDIKKNKHKKPHGGEFGRLLELSKKLGLPGDIAYRAAMRREYKNKFNKQGVYN